MSAFFHSLAFAISALVLVGISWVYIGLVMGEAPRHNVSASFVQLVMALVSLLSCLGVLVVIPSGITASWRVVAVVCAVYAFCGGINFCTLELMSLGMQRGPNGIVYAAIQAALIFPFLCGTIIFHQAASLWQWAGILGIVGALFCFGIAKDNSTTYVRKKGEFSWRVLAFLGLLSAGTQQSLTTCPSFFAETDGVPVLLRTMSILAGVPLAQLVAWAVTGKRSWTKAEAADCCRRWIFWKYVLIMWGVSFLATYLLMLPGIDVMAKHGLGGVGYPLMVGTCIVSFTLTAMFRLKERLSLLQWVGVVLCCLGLVGICLS